MKHIHTKKVEIKKSENTDERVYAANQELMLEVLPFVIDAREPVILKLRHTRKPVDMQTMEHTLVIEFYTLQQLAASIYQAMSGFGVGEGEEES